MKNKPINKFAFMFVIGLSLLFSWSHAAEIFVEGQTLLTEKGFCGATSTTTTLPSYVEGASQAEQRKFMMSTLYDYFNNRANTDYDFTNFNHLIDTSLNYYNDLHGKNYNGYYILADYISTSAYTSTFKLYFYQKNDIDILYDKIKTVGGAYHQSVSFIDGSDFIFVDVNSSGFSSKYYENAIGNCFFRFNKYYQKYSFSSNTSIKQSDTSVIDGAESYTYIFTWDGTSYYQYIEDEQEGPDLITDEEFSSVLTEVTSSELFYQHVPSDYRDNFYVQYDVNSDNYLFYFYPSNYQVYGLLRNENDYHVICDKDFSWWDNVVDFLKNIFIRNTENIDYKMIYVKVLDDGTCSSWYRSKSMLSMDETLFNFELNPIVYSSIQIPFYGQHSGGGINIDTGDVTLATEPEYVVDDETYGETNIVYNPNPIEKVENEQTFWDKVTNRLSSIVSEIKSFPEKIKNEISNMTGLTKILTLISPIGSAILIILNVLLSSISLLARAVAFVYTLPTINASDALFLVDVDSTTGLVFAGNSWGTKFLEGLNMVKEFSWNGLNLWTLFTSFIVAMFAIHCVKLVRKHYHY